MKYNQPAPSYSFPVSFPQSPLMVENGLLHRGRLADPRRSPRYPPPNNSHLLSVCVSSRMKMGGFRKSSPMSPLCLSTSCSSCCIYMGFWLIVTTISSSASTGCQVLQADQPFKILSPISTQPAAIPSCQPDVFHPMSQAECLPWLGKHNAEFVVAGSLLYCAHDDKTKGEPQVGCSRGRIWEAHPNCIHDGSTVSSRIYSQWSHQI